MLFPVMLLAGTICHEKTIATGAALHSANGFKFAPNGTVWIASGPGGELVNADPNTGAILARYGAEKGVDTLDDVEVAADGTVYWTELFTGQVGRLRPDGTADTLATLPPGANGIALNLDQTHLFVSTLRFTDTLWDITLDGSAPPRLVAENTLAGLNGFQFGPDGQIYGPRWFAGEVARIDPQTGAITTLQSGFITPLAVRIDSAGRVHAFDQGTRTVYRLDLTNGTREAVADAGATGDNFAIHSSGSIYVTGAADGSLTEVFPDGERRTVIEGGMILPSGIARTGGFLPWNQRFHVTDVFSLRTFDFNGTQTRVDDFNIGAPATSVAPSSSVNTDDDGNLLITSLLFNYVQRWNPRTHTPITTQIGEFALPIDAVDYDGGLVVADAAFGAVVRATDKSPVLTGLIFAGGLASDNNENLYAADWAGGVIWHLKKGQAPKVIVSGLAGPEGITLTRNGLIIVETLSRTVSFFNFKKKKKFVLTDEQEIGLSGGAGAPPTWVGLSRAALGPLDALYVPQDRSNKLNRYFPCFPPGGF